MRLFIKTFIYLLFSINAATAQSSLLINEIVASNINTIRDEHLDFDDWIELHNPGPDTVNISGMFLSDDIADPTKWQIPSGFSETIIYPDSFLILWADSDPTQGVLHLDFKLSSSGEDVVLTDAGGTVIIDFFSFTAQTANYSFGRSSLDSQILKHFQTPTPGLPNGKGFDGIVATPKINLAAGNYKSNVEISFNNPPDTTITYTWDGTLPRETSDIYLGPLNLSGSSVFTARAFKENFIPSIPASKTYFISENFNLPVLSVITDPANLFSDSIGIYPNYTKGSAFWERPVYLDYIKNENAEFSIRSGIRIQGRTSRVLPKKSFRIFFKSGYESDRLSYNLFDIPEVNSFKNIVLRAGYDDDISPANSAGTLLRDPLTSEAWKKAGGLTAEGNFATLYLNNDYWGIYNIRESINEFFIGDHLGIIDFDLIRYDKKGPLLQWGTFEDWDYMWNFFETSDFTSDSVYQHATQLIDIENFTSLQALVQCTEYRSWGWGAFAYKEKNETGRWRWTVWDMDRSFELEDWNGITFYQELANEKWGNLMMKQLLKNELYKNKFINRVADFLNSYFEPQNFHTLIDSLAGIISPEIPNEAIRWNSSVTKWNKNIAQLHDYTNNRPDILRGQIETNFGLDGAKTITIIQDEVRGSIKINSITINQFPWAGKYFPSIPIKITAVANPGFEFAGWSNPGLPQENSITIDPDDISTLEPIFTAQFESEYFEIIAPSVVKSNEVIPVIFRVRTTDKKIYTPLSDSLSFLHSAAFADSSLKIKKGTGIYLGNSEAIDNFDLLVDHASFDSEIKKINVDNNVPGIHYGGTTSGETIIWDNSAEHIIDSDYTISENTILQINAGTRIKIKEHVNIFINGSLIINGNKNYPVIFSSFDSEKNWGGIEFFGSNSEINYCFFIQGGGDPTKGWAHTNRQPVLFAKENSTLTLENVFILNSPGKGIGSLNSIFTMQNSIISRVYHGGEMHYSKVHVNNCYLIDIPDDLGGETNLDWDNDGFHIDYGASDGSYSLIENSFFIDGKDDAIDHHQGNLIIKNCWLQGWLHEGVAASGRDTVRILNTVSTKNTNGFEAGNGSPQVFVDHSVAIENRFGLRFGDSYTSANTGHITATNSIFYNNTIQNIRNYTKALQGPYEGGIDVSYSMTNDSLYDQNTGNITGVPLFDDYFYLLAQSPGTSAGTNGTDMGLTDERVLQTSSVVINEIMYKAASGHDTEDWVELFNPSANAKNISGWILKDFNDDFPYIIPQNTHIAGRGYLVLCRDTLLFKIEHPAVSNIIGNLQFGFSRDGETVSLFSNTGLLVDQVEYGATSPWPTSPQGEGPSLELTDPLLDNSLAESWAASSVIHGTPGSANTLYDSIKENKDIIVTDFQLLQNYPNPFNPSTNIEFNIALPAKITINIYNISGQRVMKLLQNSSMVAGNHKLQVNFSKFASGVYFYQLIIDIDGRKKIIQTKKMLLLK